MKIPSVGATVSVKTKHQNIFLYDNLSHREFLINGVVIPNAKWVGSNSFSVRTKNTDFPISVISLENVLSIESDKSSFDQTRKFKVKGSKGDTYLVTLTGKHYSCHCIGFKYHSKCKHITKVKVVVEKQQNA
jgi:hypothetical protein